MRPALIRAALVAMTVLAVALVLAPTALAAGGTEEIKREIEFKMRVDGFAVTVAGGEADGKPKVVLVLIRRHQIAECVISAFLEESGEGMTVLRGAARHVDARAFEWDFAAGTATVSPLAPFIGRARFTRQAGGRPLWTGSLRVPILGETNPVSMAGAAFRVVLHHGLSRDD